jgi:coenzyme F420-reducing hydrogenase alpha subunit
MRIPISPVERSLPNEQGAIVWANLTVTTGHNLLAMNRSIQQVSEHFVIGTRLQEGMLNRSRRSCAPMMPA